MLSHGSADCDDRVVAAAQRAAAAAYRDSATPATQRGRLQLYDLLAGLDLVPPGLVDVTAGPAPTEEHGDPGGSRDRVGAYAAVARLP